MLFTLHLASRRAMRRAGGIFHYDDMTTFSSCSPAADAYFARKAQPELLSARRAISKIQNARNIELETIYLYVKTRSLIIDREH